MCFQLLFIHSISVSEMTSRIFGVGKTAFQKLAKGDPVLRFCVNAFPVPSQITLVIYRHRSQVIGGLFGRQGTHSPATMRYSTFRKKVVSASSFVKTEHLLSTECVAKLYFCRTYLPPGQDMITVSNVIKLFVSTIYPLSYSSPIDATSGI